MKKRNFTKLKMFTTSIFLIFYCIPANASVYNGNISPLEAAKVFAAIYIVLLLAYIIRIAIWFVKGDREPFLKCMARDLRYEGDTYFEYATSTFLIYNCVLFIIALIIGIYSIL